MGKEGEDGDKCDRDRMLGKVRHIWGGREMGSLDGQKRGSSSTDPL